MKKNKALCNYNEMKQLSLKSVSISPDSQQQKEVTPKRKSADFFAFSFILVSSSLETESTAPSQKSIVYQSNHSIVYLVSRNFSYLEMKFREQNQFLFNEEK